MAVPRWVDVHSVTCALCGGLADEREAVSLWNDESNPLLDDPTVDLTTLPDGEAHVACFNERVTADGGNA